MIDRREFIQLSIGGVIGSLVAKDVLQEDFELATIYPCDELRLYRERSHQWPIYNRTGPDLSIESLTRAIENFKRPQRLI